MKVLPRPCALLVVLVSSLSAQKPSLTAQQVVDRIEQHLGVPLPAGTVDTFKAGDPGTPVTGIAVTMMATYDVLERAAASGANFVITHEPTFYNHQDSTGALEKQKDAVLGAKQAFIADHHLVVWRFHDGWHARHPDGILLGMTKALGWQRFQDVSEPHVYVIPRTSLNHLAHDIERTLGIKTMRLVGDPGLQITNLAFLPGAAGSARQIQLLERPDVEALLVGETPEWETAEYVADSVSEGKRKALIILGHIPSEQAGMQECAVWLRSFLPEIPINFVPTKEPFFRPGE